MSAHYAYVGPDRSKGPLKIDSAKALWLMRMVYGEGGRRCSKEKVAALLWAIVNRWFLWKPALLFPTFVSMVRAFSQPINPRWMTGGDLARKWAGKDPASVSRLRRRARICKMTEDDMPVTIRRAVEMFANGVLFPPNVLSTLEKPRISNWASLNSTPRKFPWGVDVSGDWFFEDRGLRDGFVSVRVPA